MKLWQFQPERDKGMDTSKWRLLKATLIILGLALFVGIDANGQGFDLETIYKRISEGGGEGVFSVWKDLGIREEFFKADTEFRVYRSFFDCPSSPKGAVLEITDSFAWNWRYLLFRQEKEGWIFLGNIDLSVQKYDPPTYRIQKVGERGCWLVLRSMRNGGTGIVEYVDTWYDLMQGKLRAVLEYPKDGHISWPSPFDREYSSTVLAVGQKEGRYVIEIQFKATYTNSSFWAYKYSDLKNVDVLFSITRKVFYVWDAASQFFRIDDLNSQLSEEQIWGLVDDHGDSFLNNNYEELAKLAESERPEVRLWLARFLDECRNTARKLDLLRFLRKSSRLP
jgi:hypothetical protein